MNQELTNELEMDIVVLSGVGVNGCKIGTQMKLMEGLFNNYP